MERKVSAKLTFYHWR